MLQISTLPLQSVPAQLLIVVTCSILYIKINIISENISEISLDICTNCKSGTHQGEKSWGK